MKPQIFLNADMKRKAADTIPLPVDDVRAANEPASLLPSGTILDLTSTGERRSDEQKIRELAFHFYEERGRVEGKALDDWLKAESLIRGRQDMAA